MPGKAPGRRRPGARSGPRSGAPRIEACQRAHEGRSRAEQERLPGSLGEQDGVGDGLQVGVRGGVDQHPGLVSRRRQHLADPGWPAGPDVVKADAEDVLRPDRPAALCREEVAEVRIGVSEHAVPGELGRCDGHHASLRARPVDVAGRQPASMNAGANSTASGAAVAGLTARRGERLDLGDHVPAQGGVAAADQVDPRAPPPGNGHQAARDLRAQRRRLGPGEAARVRQHEADGAAGRRRECVLVGPFAGHHDDLDVMDRL